MNGLDYLSILDLMDFIIVNLINVFLALNFISRVKKPNLVKPLGIFLDSICIPSCILAILNIITFRPIIYYLGPLIYVVFCIFDIILDYKKIEFRNPMKPKILAPYLLLFYTSIFIMGIILWDFNFILWMITAITTVVQLITMVYASKHGKG
ncbi:MAG: hypothetical protein ACTSPY_08100 [Candidatus Helarchaeota archaeon]